MSENTEYFLAVLCCFVLLICMGTCFGQWVNNEAGLTYFCRQVSYGVDPQQKIYGNFSLDFEFLQEIHSEANTSLGNLSRLFRKTIILNKHQ